MAPLLFSEEVKVKTKICSNVLNHFEIIMQQTYEENFRYSK
jgi:hypothetical protein